MYMKPLTNAEGNSINWINYKTGVRNIYFRMDAAKRNATIAIEITHTSQEERALVFEQFESLKSYFKDILNEDWEWQSLFYDEDGRSASRIYYSLDDVSVFKKEDWPSIISFLKERIVKLDTFWNDVKVQFER